MTKFNAHQNRYIAARAIYKACFAAAIAAYPVAPTATDANDPAWDAHFDAQEDVDVATGLNAARNELFDAEQALIAWGKTTELARISGLDFDEAARMPSTRTKLVDLLARGPA